MAALLLDTNVLIDFLRGYPRAVRLITEARRRGTLLCSIVSAFELHEGCRNAAERSQIDCFLRAFQVVPIEAEDSMRALDWFRQWRLSHGVGMLDCLIAAAAGRLAVPFFTRDQGHFSPFPSLDLRQPY